MYIIIINNIIGHEELFYYTYNNFNLITYFESSWKNTFLIFSQSLSQIKTYN